MIEAPPATKKPALAPISIKVRQQNGSIFIGSTEPLGSYPDNFAQHLWRWSQETPNSIFLAERRDSGAWHSLTYFDAFNSACKLSNFLLDIQLHRNGTLLIINDNSILHGLIILASMQIGAISTAIPEINLKGIDSVEKILGEKLALLKPKAVYVADGWQGIRSPVLENYIITSGAHLLTQDLLESITNSPDDCIGNLEQYLNPRGLVRHQTPARIFFTSGSTGAPKAVAMTHGMLGAQQQMMVQCWRFLEESPPVLVDWLPWTHTSGGVNSFNMTLRNGGSLYIDEGQPKPGKFCDTIRNLKSVSPTWYTNVPLGYQMLVPELERDKELRDSFFCRLDMALYGGATLDNSTWQRLHTAIGKETKGRAVLGCGWGSTETSSTACVVHHPRAQNGSIGHPLPGITLRLEPNQGAFHVSVQGPSVAKSYLGGKAKIVDSDGFLPMGDMLGFINPNRPEDGLYYKGRLAENFKLANGEWVQSTWLRSRLVGELYPNVLQLLIAGHGRKDLRAIVWLSATGDRDAVLNSISQWNTNHPKSTQRIAAVGFSDRPLSLEKGEVTQKGALNQSICFDTRRAELRSLYQEEVV